MGNYLLFDKRGSQSHSVGSFLQAWEDLLRIRTLIDAPQEVEREIACLLDHHDAQLLAVVFESLGIELNPLNFRIHRARFASETGTYLSDLDDHLDLGEFADKFAAHHGLKPPSINNPAVVAWPLEFEGLDIASACAQFRREAGAEALAPAGARDSLNIAEQQNTTSNEEPLERTRILTCQQAAKYLNHGKKHSNPAMYIRRLIKKGPGSGGIHSSIGTGQQRRYALSDFPECYHNVLRESAVEIKRDFQTNEIEQI